MSRISIVAASVAFLLVLSAGPAQAASLDRGAAITPGVGAVVGGGASTQGVLTWICQVILGQCK
jgi:hypothetical protein